MITILMKNDRYANLNGQIRGLERKTDIINKLCETRRYRREAHYAPLRRDIIKRFGKAKDRKFEHDEER